MEITEEKLLEIVKHIEALEEDKASLTLELKAVFDEAKLQGFDVKILRQIVKLRKMEPSKRHEQESLLKAYLAALGME